MSAEKGENAKDEKEPKAERSQVIRLRKGQAQKLSEIGDKFGTSQGQLVNWAVEALIRKVEDSGGKLTLPFDLGSSAPAPVEGSERFSSLNEEYRREGVPTHYDKG